MASGIRKLYIARCPKCNEPLKEISYVPVYRCGSCNAILLANCWKTVLERVASTNPESTPPKENVSSSGDNINGSIPHSSMTTACFTSDAVDQVLKNEAERKINVDDAYGPFGSSSCENHVDRGQSDNDQSDNVQSDNEESSYLKDAYKSYSEKDKEALSPMSFDVHTCRDESDNGTSTIYNPLTSLSKEDSSCLKDVHTVYNKQNKETLPSNPVPECIFDGRVEDGGNNWDGHRAENLAVNNDQYVETSSHNDVSVIEAMDTAFPNVHVYAFNVSYPDDKCGNCISECTKTSKTENLECDSSQKQSLEYISNGVVDKGYYLDAAGQTETLTENNEKFVEPSDDTDTSEKVLVDESTSNGAIVNTYENVSSSSDRCGKPTSEESEIWTSENLEHNTYEEYSPETIFDRRKEDKGKSLESDQVGASLDYNEQSVSPSAEYYKSEEVLVGECFSNGVFRNIESPNIHFDALNENVSSDDQCIENSFGEHESWNIENPECNPYQQMNPCDHLDNNGCSLMMHRTTDNESIGGDSSSGSNFCGTVETDFIDVEGSITSRENIEGFQESINSIVIQQVLDHNLNTGGIGNTKPDKQVTDMYLHEEENGSGNESDDCLSASDAIKNPTSLFDTGNHDKKNDGFPTALPEIVKDEICNVITPTDNPFHGPSCQASMTIVAEITDPTVMKVETVSLETERTEDVSLPIHTSFLDIESNLLHKESDDGRCTLSDRHESLLCLVDDENNSNETVGETDSYKYDCNEAGHEEQINNSSIYTIFDSESSRLEESAVSSTHFFANEEAVYEKLDNETDREMEPPKNMFSNAEIDMSKDILDSGGYSLSDTKESMFCSSDANTHTKGDQGDSDQIYLSFCSDGCIGVNEERISSTSNAVGVKISETVTETRKSTNLVVIQGQVIKEDLYSARVRNMEHSDSIQKKTSGNESNTDQHTLCDENASMQLVLDAVSLDEENLKENVLSPSSPCHYYSLKQGFNEEGDDNECNKNASAQFFLDVAACDKENLRNDVVSPGSSTHCFSTKEGSNDKEEDNVCDCNRQMRDSEYNSIYIPFSAEENDESTCVLFNQDARKVQGLVARSEDNQYPFYICNDSLQISLEKGPDYVDSTLDNDNKCLPPGLEMNPSETEFNSAHGTLDNGDKQLCGLFVSTTTDQENKKADDAVASSIISLPVSRHVIGDKVNDKAHSDFCEQTEYQEDDLHKSQTLRPIGELEETCGHFAISKDAPDLILEDERAKTMTLPIHCSLLSNFAEKESISNPCVLNNNDLLFCLNDGNTCDNGKEASADAIRVDTVYGDSGQIDTSHCVSSGIRASRLMEEKEELLKKEAGSQCVIWENDTNSMSSNSINSDAQREIDPFSGSRRQNQINPESQLFQQQECFSSKENILSYGSDCNDLRLEEGKASPTKEAALCSIAADTEPGRYLEKHPSDSRYMLNSEEIIENVKVSEAYSKLNKQVDSFDYQPIITVSHKPMEVMEHVKISSGSHFLKMEVTDMNCNTTGYALSPTYKSSLDHDGCFSSIDEIYWNQVSKQHRGKRTARPQKIRDPFTNKEKSKGKMASTSSEMSSTSQVLAPAKSRLSSEHRRASRTLVETLPENEASWLQPKQETAGSSDEFYSADNRTASESEAPKASSIESAARKLISSHHNSSRHPMSKISKEECTELVRKIDELRSQLIRSDDQTGKYRWTFSRETERVNEQPTVSRHPFEQEQHQSSPSTSPALGNRAGTVRSVEKVSEKHMFLQMSNSGKINWYLNQKQEYNQFVNRISPYSPPVSRPERARHIPSGTGLQVRSEPNSPFSRNATPKQEHGIHMVQLGRAKKQHCRPILGGAQFIICNECLQLLRMPEDFQISKKSCKLRCGSCSSVLQFSLIGRTHIVPHMQKQS